MSGGDWKEMYVAVQKGNFELVKYHIENGVDPNYQHPEILGSSSMTGAVRILLECFYDKTSNKGDPGAPINSRAYHWFT